MRPRRGAFPLMLGLAAAVALGSCAYYNTYYLARKYYDRATGGLPYLQEKSEQSNDPNFKKAIEYANKVVSQYPKDKLVDDAYILWARGLIGVDDPRQAIKLLEEFPALFPSSPLKPDAHFYLGVAYRQSRKYTNALRSFDEFLAGASKKNDLIPYAHLERARVLMSLERPAESAAAAGEVVTRYSKFRLIDRARLARAEALLAQGAYDEARQAFRDLGTRADNDADRLKYLLREADCLEVAHRYEDELKLLTDAIAHERPPIPVDSTAVEARGPESRIVQPGVAGSEGYGRLLVRIGTAKLLGEHLDEALEAYRRVARDYAHSPLAAEAQYRIGYAYETAADDFEKARLEYAKVRDHGGGGGFVDQAGTRVANLDRLAQFRSAAGDSNEKKAESGFLLAEVYLFQLNKPERALEEYRKVATEFAGKPMAAKAMNAQAWVLSRKLERRVEADSLFWAVVNQYPKTEAQLAARDYLELEGVSVPEHLIQLPEPQYARADTTPAPVLPPVPTALDEAPELTPMPIDSLRIGPGRPGFPSPSLINPRGVPTPTATNPHAPSVPLPPPAAFRAPAPRDTTRLPGTARRDSSNVSPTQPGLPAPAFRDSAKAPK